MMNSRFASRSGLLGLLLAAAAATLATGAEEPKDLVIAPGPYRPTPDSLKQYQCPEWFRDAKFGIWALW